MGGLVKSIFGGGGKTGIAGTGRFKGQSREIDRGAFNIGRAEEFRQKSAREEDRARGRSLKAERDRADFISDLQKQARGEGPSLAEAQLKAATDRNLAQQLAAAQTQRGGSASARQRNLARSQAESGRELAQQSAQARLQEQQQAQQQLGEQISQEQQLADQLTQQYIAQGFTIEQARQQALADFEKLATQQTLGIQQINLGGAQSAAKNRAGLFGGALSAIGASDVKSKKNIKKAKSQDIDDILKKGKEKNQENFQNQEKADDDKKKKLGALKLAAAFLSDEKSKKNKKKLSKEEVVAKNMATIKSYKKSDEEKKERRKKKKEEIQKDIADSFDGKGHQIIGKKIGEGLKHVFSDKNMKKDMESYSDSDMKDALQPKKLKKDFLDKLKGYTYEYKNKYKSDPRAGDGRHMSVMAQDLEKAGPIGKSMVEEDYSGLKLVNYAKGYGAILAAQAMLNDRLNKLEKKKK